MIIVNLTEKIALNKADWKDKCSCIQLQSLDKGFVVVISEMTLVFINEQIDVALIMDNALMYNIGRKYLDVLHFTNHVSFSLFCYDLSLK